MGYTKHNFEKIKLQLLILRTLYKSTLDIELIKIISELLDEYHKLNNLG